MKKGGMRERKREIEGRREREGARRDGKRERKGRREGEEEIEYKISQVVNSEVMASVYGLS